jgi:hypothetical protein
MNLKAECSRIIGIIRIYADLALGLLFFFFFCVCAETGSDREHKVSIYVSLLVCYKLGLYSMWRHFIVKLFMWFDLHCL